MSRGEGSTGQRLWSDPALAELVERETAAVLWSLDGNRVIGASVGTAGLAPALRAAGGENLRGRLRRVAAALSAGSGVRLERVTLPQGYGVTRLLLECHRVATKDGEFLLTILRGPLPRLPRVVAEGPADAEAAPAAAAGPVALRHERAASGGAGVQQNPVERLLAFAGRRSTVRFIWESDADGRITRVSDELAGLVGQAAGAIEGRSWPALVAAGIFADPGGAVAAALAQHGTWSGKEVLWRLGDDATTQPLPVELAGIPIHDGKRRFRGYRGFGLVRVSRLREAASALLPGHGLPADHDLPRREEHRQEEHRQEDPRQEDPRQEDPRQEDPRHEEPRHEEPRSGLSDNERQAFRDIARALGGTRLSSDDVAAAETKSPVPPATDGEAAPGRGVRRLRLVAGDADRAADTGPIQDGDEADRLPGSPAPERHPAGAAGAGQAPGEGMAHDPPAWAAAEEGDDGAAQAGEDSWAGTGWTDSVWADSTPAEEVRNEEGPREDHFREDHPREDHLHEDRPREDTLAGKGGFDEASAEESPEWPQPPAAGPDADIDARRDPDDVASPVAAELWGGEPVPARARAPQAGPDAPAAAARDGVDAGASVALIANRLPIGMLVSRDGEALFVNRALLDLLGYDDASAFRRAGGLRSLFMSAPGGGEAPLALRTAYGAPLSVDARMATIPWRDAAAGQERPATLMSFRRAIEPRTEAHLRALERELRHQEARVRALDTILDTATDGVVTLDGLGRLLSMNRSAEALFGCEETDVVGGSFWHLLAPQSRTGAAAYFEGLRAGGLASVLNDGIAVRARAAPAGFSLRGLPSAGFPSAGGEIPLMMIMGRLAPDPGDETPGIGRLPAGRSQRFFAILRDVSVAAAAGAGVQGGVSADQQRESADQAQFLARVSHEIRTPLNAIIGFTEIMLEERFGSIGIERYRDYLRDIHASGGQVISLVNDLLDLARIEAGRLELAPADVPLNDVVAGCVGLMMPQAQRQRVVLRTSLLPELASVNADERALQQIVLNLLSNAVKFTDAGGQVIVSTARADDGTATLRIRDTGIGMTRAQVSAALTPFAQLNTTHLGRADGAGLGLPLTRALVEASGGRFAIISEPMEGTLVEIAFPPVRSPGRPHTVSG